jgi:hypothetical protein
MAADDAAARLAYLRYATSPAGAMADALVRAEWEKMNVPPPVQAQLDMLPAIVAAAEAAPAAAAAAAQAMRVARADAVTRLADARRAHAARMPRAKARAQVMKNAEIAAVKAAALASSTPQLADRAQGGTDD